VLKVLIDLLERTKPYYVLSNLANVIATTRFMDGKLLPFFPKCMQKTIGANLLKKYNL
jgi:hypothetical protein